MNRNTPKTTPVDKVITIQYAPSDIVGGCDGVSDQTFVLLSRVYPLIYPLIFSIFFQVIQQVRNQRCQLNPFYLLEADEISGLSGDHAAANL
jgi:hypothetical protein